MKTIATPTKSTCYASQFKNNSEILWLNWMNIFVKQLEEMVHVYAINGSRLTNRTTMTVNVSGQVYYNVTPSFQGTFSGGTRTIWQGVTLFLIVRQNLQHYIKTNKKCLTKNNRVTPTSRTMLVTYVQNVTGWDSACACKLFGFSIPIQQMTLRNEFGQ